jgi:ADP-ribose pyrophosphatase YjhB (NUDIX family)
MTTDDIAARLADWADQIRGIAQTGIHYNESGYNRERYERLLGIAAEMASGITAEPAEALVDAWRADGGYVTPKVGVDAVIFDSAGRVLLLKRPDTGRWALPGGWAESGSTAAANAAREVAEEVGLTVRVAGLLGVYDSRLNGSKQLHHFYDVVFRCDVLAGEAAPSPEALEVGYFGEGELPEVAPSHRRPIADAFAWRAGRLPAAAFEE